MRHGSLGINFTVVVHCVQHSCLVRKLQISMNSNIGKDKEVDEKGMKLRKLIINLKNKSTTYTSSKFLGVTSLSGVHYHDHHDPRIPTSTTLTLPFSFHPKSITTCSNFPTKSTHQYSD